MDRAGARRHDADPLRRSVLRPGGGRHPAELGRPEQDRDPAGGRAAATAGEPDRDGHRRQEAAAALLVPAARAQGRGHHDRRRPRATAGRPGASRSSPRRARPAATVAQWECIRGTSYIYPHTQTSRTRRPRATRPRASRWALHLTTDCADYTPASIEDNYVAQIDAWTREVHEPRATDDAAAPTASPGATGSARRGGARPRDPARRELLLLAAGLGPGRAGHVHRLGDADALRRHRRVDARRLPVDDADDRRVRADVPVHDQHAARPRARRPGLLRRVQREHAHRRRQLARARRRSSPRPRRAACPWSPRSRC